MGLNTEENLIAQLKCCHDLHKADGESMLIRTAIADVVSNSDRN